MAFTVADAEGQNQEVWIADADTGDYRMVLSAPNVQAFGVQTVWIASNGQLIIRQGSNKGSQPFRLFKGDGTEIPLNLPHDIPSNAVVSWSPDGAYFALVGNSKVVILRNDGNIVHTFEGIEMDDFTIYDWTPCDQLFTGWSARNPAEYPLWP